MYSSRNGREHTLPDPVLMMRSAAERWDRYAWVHLVGQLLDRTVVGAPADRGGDRRGRSP